MPSRTIVETSLELGQAITFGNNGLIQLASEWRPKYNAYMSAIAAERLEIQQALVERTGLDWSEIVAMAQAIESIVSQIESAGLTTIKNVFR